MEGNIKAFHLLVCSIFAETALRDWLTSLEFTCCETSDMWTCGPPLCNKWMLNCGDMSSYPVCSVPPQLSQSVSLGCLI